MFYINIFRIFTGNTEHMDISNFIKKIDFIAIDYAARLALLHQESLSTHEHDKKWNEMQHSLLSRIEAETKSFISPFGLTSQEDGIRLVEAVKSVLAAYNIKFTVQGAYA